MPPNDNGWDEWQQYVITSIQELKDDQRDFRHEVKGEFTAVRAENKAEFASIRLAMQSYDREIAQLQVKSGLWGAAAGMIPLTLKMLWEMAKETLSRGGQ